MQAARFVLVMGDKNYSSWSLRPWLMLRQCGVAFDEALIRLRQVDSKEKLKARSPSGLVPVLYHGKRVIWDSLAIGEYLAELFPEAGLWPQDRHARARARCVSAEMHSGFAPLRETMPMDFLGRRKGFVPGAAAQENIDRILALWAECRTRHGAGGPFLFGRRTIADAMYAPVVSRFRTYEIAVGDVARAYMDAVWDLPDMADWARGAAREMTAAEAPDSPSP